MLKWPYSLIIIGPFFMKFAQIVIGSGFGDEGKGLMTDYFCHHYSLSNPIVIRYNGGAQAGHTVKTPDGLKHVFHHLGSGTLQGVSSYLAEDFIVNPIIFNKEYDEMRNMNRVPLVYVHPSCRITTPYDMLLNQIIEHSRDNRHGSCGMGIFETITRHNVIPITVESLLNMPFATFRQLLIDVQMYVYNRISTLGIILSNYYQELLEMDVSEQFISDIQMFFSRTYTTPYTGLKKYDTCIFEGAQGLLLSEKHGIMPHLTPSDPGLANPIKICNEIGVKNASVCYVTRCYTTRHGNGPLKDEMSLEQLQLTVNDETNVYNEFQGNFRYARLDINSIQEAINNDSKEISNYNGIMTRQLAITCIDQLPSYLNEVTVDNKLFMQYIRDKIGIIDGFYSTGPTRKNVYTAI